MRHIATDLDAPAMNDSTANATGELDSNPSGSKEAQAEESSLPEESSLSEEESLLVSLSSYRPRPGRKSIEDYITEAFAWLLSSRDELGRDFLKETVEGQLEGQIQQEDKSSVSVEWSTQVRFSKSRPDMVSKVGGETVVFEHKIHEEACKDQLKRHRKGLREDPEYGRGPLVLITSARLHFQDPADVKITWPEIHQWLGAKSEKEDRMVQEFRALLESQGLSPRPTLQETSLRAYLPAQKVEQQVSDLFEDLWSRTEEWDFLFEEPHLSRENSELKSKKTSEGRLGIQVNGDPPNVWAPGIFAGVHLDGEDHEVEMSNPQLGPDLAVVLDVGEQIAGMPRQEFLSGPLYRELSSRLKEEAESRNWDVVDTYGRPGGGNAWHPLIIRRPLAEVLRGTSSFEEQAQATLEALKDGLRFLLKDEQVREIGLEE